MTTSKYQESIKELSSADDTKRLKALRFIKNSVIGNKTKKDLYIKLGVVQRFVMAFASTTIMHSSHLYLGWSTTFRYRTIPAQTH